MNRFLLFFLFYFSQYAFRSRKFSVFTARIRSDNRESPILFQPERTYHSLKQLIKPVMNDLQNRRFMTIWRISSVCRIPPWFLLEKYANRNQSERFKSTRSSGTEPRLYHGNFGMYKEATDILVKNPGNRSPELKGSYYVVNRVL
jgi:hypothetical protein